jgi:hypothetical protein
MGALNVSGSLTLDAGATWAVDLSASSSDLLTLGAGSSLTSNGATLRPVFADGLGPAGNDVFWSYAQLWTVVSGDPAKTVSGSWVIDNSAWTGKGVFQTWPSGENLVLGWAPTVPEPETYAYLACTATMGLALRRRRSAAPERKTDFTGTTVLIPGDDSEDSTRESPP